MNEIQQQNAFISVLRRELRRMVSRRLYFGVCIVLPLFSLFFMSTIFGNGQMENIPIGIVDQDQTALSREISRQVEAVPTFRVTRQYIDPEAARQATQAKEIYGYLVIPDNFEANATSGRDATLSYYYHYALLSVGGELKGAFETVLRTLSLGPVVMQATSLGVGENQITTFLLPVQASNHPLFNPDLDYSVYLSNPFFYIFLQVIILLVTVYVIGSEIKFRTADDWLSAARGNICTAVAAKLLPYTIIFSVMSIFGNYIIYPSPVVSGRSI
jgi:ABC-2 type transport system permease protein